MLMPLAIRFRELYSGRLISARSSTVLLGVVRVQVPHEAFPDVVGEVGRRPAFREDGSLSLTESFLNARAQISQELRRGFT